MKLNVKKTLLTLLVTSTLALTRSAVSAKGGFVDRGDYVKSTDLLNIRLDHDLKSDVIGMIKEKDVAYRILSVDDNWDLVNYQGTIGYVSRNYLEETNEVVDDAVHYLVEDIVTTTSKVNFRLEPTLDGKRIDSIPKGERLLVFAKTDTNWYLVNYKGTIGYVSGDYVESLLLKVDRAYPDLALDNLRIERVVYATSNLNVRIGASVDYEKIGLLNKYESVLVLKEYGDWYFVLNNDGLVGFVAKEYTKVLQGVYVIIDISDQRIWLYDDQEMLLTSSIVTGKTSTPTYVGLFNIDAKERNRYLVGEDYKSYVKYWLPFDGGIGLHDANWRSNFGGTIYVNNGSHGCVNLPEEVAKKIYNEVTVGTKVLVHK